jgi:hypothetical protein
MVAWRPPHGLTLAIIPISWEAGGLRIAVRRLRRALRDFRDRMARRSGRWRGVCLSGLVMGNRTAMVVIDGGAVDRAELSRALRRRWADASVTNLVDREPSADMAVSDAIELAMLRRGAEPIRLLVLPQLGPPVRTVSVIDPMPVIVS